MNVDLFYLAGMEGFEPPNAGTRNQCLTTWRHPNINVKCSLASVLDVSGPSAGTIYDFVVTGDNRQCLTTWRHPNDVAYKR